MKNIIITGLLIFCLSGLTFAQVGKMQDDTLINYVDINKKKQGKWVKYYDSGKMRYKGFFVNDIPTGTFMFYHTNGKIKSVLNYDDKGFSTAELYWKNGNKAAKGFYNADNIRIKTWKIYFEDGTLGSIINYNLDGKADGEVIMYYPSTERKVLHCHYKNGKKHGHYIKYFKSGITQEEGDYENNRKVGHWKLFSPEGVLEEQGPYVNGSRHGDWLVYSDDKPVDTVNYNMGHPDNYDEEMQKLMDKEEWAKANQDKFKQPEDYMDNPIEFFRP